MHSHDTTSAALGILESRVTGLEGGVSAISAQISALADKIDKRGQTPWPLLVSLGGLGFTIIAGIGWLAYAPVIATQVRFDFDAREHYRELKAEITRVDRDTPNRAEYDRGRLVNDRNLERLERRLDRLEYGKTP